MRNYLRWFPEGKILSFTIGFDEYRLLLEYRLTVVRIVFHQISTFHETNDLQADNNNLINSYGAIGILFWVFQLTFMTNYN